LYSVPGPNEVMRGGEELPSGMIENEGMAIKMDDLSDRIDAIIRHASYLESQLRSVSDQLYQSQQNEVNLGNHVQHLEMQMRSLEERLQQSRSIGGGPPSIVAPPTPTQRQQGSSPPPPPPALVSSIPSSSTRDQSRSMNPSTTYPAHSPVSSSHPSYSSSFTRSAVPSHSSADAYQKLPPPPPPSSSIRRDEPHSPAESADKRYRA
jgi:hypothetical protein